jgi:hydrogenase maturation protease
VGAVGASLAPCKLRVIAVGSPFGADRIAWDVVEAMGPLPDGIEAVCCVNPLSELPALLRSAETVLLVDAMLGVPLGTVLRCSRDDLKAREREMSSHGLSVDLALDLAAALGELPPRLVVIGLGIGSGAEQGKVSLQGAANRYASALRGEIERRSPPLAGRGAIANEEANA